MQIPFIFFTDAGVVVGNSSVLSFVVRCTGMLSIGMLRFYEFYNSDFATARAINSDDEVIIKTSPSVQ